MAVEEVVIAGGITSSAKGTSDQNVTYSYKSSFRVKTAATDMPRVIYDHFRATSTLPWPGRRYNLGYGSDERVICNGISPERDEKGEGWWTVSADYETNAASGNEDKNDEGESRPDANGKMTTNPMDWAWDIRMDELSISIPVEEGEFIQSINPQPKVGAPFFELKPGTKGAVVNSAGVPFDPPLEDELKIRVFSLTKYAGYYDGDEDNYWKNVVNSDDVTINWPTYNFQDRWKKQTAKVASFSSNHVFVNNMSLWRATLIIHINPRGWRPVLLDRGSERGAGYGDPDGKGGLLTTADIKDGMAMTAPIKDKDGYPVASPVLLNGRGQPLNPGQPHCFLEYRVKEERPFAPLINGLGAA